MTKQQMEIEIRFTVHMDVDSLSPKDAEENETEAVRIMLSQFGLDYSDLITAEHSTNGEITITDKNNNHITLLAHSFTSEILSELDPPDCGYDKTVWADIAYEQGNDA